MSKSELEIAEKKIDCIIGRLIWELTGEEYICLDLKDVFYHVSSDQDTIWTVHVCPRHRLLSIMFPEMVKIAINIFGIKPRGAESSIVTEEPRTIARDIITVDKGQIVWSAADIENMHDKVHELLKRLAVSDTTIAHCPFCTEYIRPAETD